MANGKGRMTRGQFIRKAGAGAVALGAAAAGLASGGPSAPPGGPNELEGGSYWQNGRVVNIYPSDPVSRIQELLDGANDRDTFYFNPGVYDFGVPDGGDDAPLSWDQSLGMNGYPKMFLDIGKPGISVRVSGDPNSQPKIMNGLNTLRVKDGKVLVENLHVEGARFSALDIVRSDGCVVRNCTFKDTLLGSSAIVTSSIGFAEYASISLQLNGFEQNILDDPNHSFLTADFSVVNLRGSYVFRDNHFVHTEKLDFFPKGAFSAFGTFDTLGPVNVSYLDNTVVNHHLGYDFAGIGNTDSYIEASGNLAESCMFPMTVRGPHILCDNLARFKVSGNILGTAAAPTSGIGFSCSGMSASGEFSDNAIGILSEKRNMISSNAGILAISNGTVFSGNTISGSCDEGISVEGNANRFEGNDLSGLTASRAQVLIAQGSFSNYVGQGPDGNKNRFGALAPQPKANSARIVCNGYSNAFEGNIYSGDASVWEMGHGIWLMGPHSYGNVVKVGPSEVLGSLAPGAKIRDYWKDQSGKNTFELIP